jgi:hypothetical protein
MTTGMSKQCEKTESPPILESPKNGAPRRYTLLALGFNLGLVLVAISMIWDLWFGKPFATALERFWLVLYSVGLGLSAWTWLASSTLPLWMRRALICGALALIAYGGVDSAREFDAEGQVLLPGRIVRDRFVHDGLGVSFKVPHNMRLLRDVSVTSPYSGQDASRNRLRFGEQATLFRMALPNDPEGKSSPIRLHVKPFQFSRLDVVVLQVLNQQTGLASQQGVRLVRPMRLYQLGQLDIVEFEILRDPKPALTRYVYLRSGSYLLTFVLTSPNAQDRALFDDFIQSIQITHRTTRFNA